MRLIAEVLVMTSVTEMNIYTGAVVFNLALAYHAKGSAACIAKAEKLYAMVISLLDNTVLNMHTAVMVKLAAISNLSQIQCALGNYRHMQEDLSKVSLFFQDSSCQSVLEEPAIQALLMNVLLLRVPTIAPAA